MYMKSYPLQNTNILRINFEKKKINASPEYQREGDIWTLDKKQLLIDSLINDYDIPKLYFHVLSDKFKKDNNIEPSLEYAIVDGRQRMETIWGFINGEFPLSTDFVYFSDLKKTAAGLTYSELGEKFPELKIKFDSVQLPVICIETDDMDVIEDMFLRLNEAVSLNAAERRNALGGHMVKRINDLSNSKFFTDKVKFSNKRYQYKEAAVKILYLEYTLTDQQKIIDTKKAYLDEFVKKFKVKNEMNCNEYFNNALSILNDFIEVFNNRDTLLVAQSIIPVYYLVYRNLKKSGKEKLFKREIIEEFRSDLTDNNRTAAVTIENADYELLEFSRLSLQGTNDASSIKERVRILTEYVLKTV